MGSVSDKAANLLRALRAREAFLTSGELDGHVRELILNSWRRSRFWGVPVEQGETPYRDDINIDSRLVAAAQPVLDRLEREMADARMSVILTDAHAWVLDRRAGERSLNSYLDKVLLAPGFSYSEQHIGTNGSRPASACSAGSAGPGRWRSACCCSTPPSCARSCGC